MKLETIEFYLSEERTCIFKEAAKKSSVEFELADECPYQEMNKVIIKYNTNYDLVMFGIMCGLDSKQEPYKKII